MKEHKNKLIVIVQIVTALIASFICLLAVEKVVFAIYLEMNDGIYPPFMPSVVSATSYFVGGFIVGLVSLIILFRANNKEKVISGIIVVIFIALFLMLYDVEPVVSAHTLRYEVILGGGLFLAMYILLKKYMASNKALK